MDLQLAGKKVLVTGSTAGIGRAIAQGFAQEGAHVVVNGRTDARVAKARDEIAAASPGSQVEGVAADVSTEEGARRLIEAVPEVDVLVNNAGIFAPRSISEWTTQDWTQMFHTNVMSGVWLSQHYLPRMLERNQGRIVFISSESAVQIPAEMIHYGVSKASQAAFARGLAELTRGTAVAVNTVLAGPTWSEGVGTFVGELAVQQNKTNAEMEKEFFSTVRPTSLIQRFATIEEIANIVVFISSSAAAVVSGAAIRAEGGLLKGVY